MVILTPEGIRGYINVGHVMVVAWCPGRCWETELLEDKKNPSLGHGRLRAAQEWKEWRSTSLCYGLAGQESTTGHFNVM